jgi:sulfite exporter TauE/SafE
MCGGFVVWYAGQGGRGGRVLAHLAYSGGRLISYAVLGALAGTLGAGIERAGAMVGVSRAATIVAGVLMLGWGAVQILQSLGVRLLAPSGPAPSAGWIAARLRALNDQPATVRALAIGLLSTLLPCGWLYLFVAPAAATGSPFGGALVMIAFWAGTLPIMTGIGLVAQGALGPLRRRLPLVTATVMIVVGLLTLAGKMNPPGRHAHPHGGGTSHVGH